MTLNIILFNNYTFAKLKTYHKDYYSNTILLNKFITFSGVNSL